MKIITLDKTSETPLTEQIFQGIEKLINERALRNGTRMPSIRVFSTSHDVSRFTSVQAYDRLVAAGYLESRPGSGFYVTSRTTYLGKAKPSIKLDRAMDVLWLLRNALSQPNIEPIPGSGWLPYEWMDTTGIQRSLRLIAQKTGRHLTEYGTPQGYLPLRLQLQQRLAEHQIQTETDQILLTAGASHAVDLITRYYVRPDDIVFVDDPGYFILHGTLKSYGAKIVGVPWNTEGPDIDKLEQLIKEHKPKLFFTNSILHNPTGASITQAVAYRLLQLVENNNMIIIEDDVFGDFHPDSISRLATLDQLNRVIYIGSFSKTISSAMRVGFIAGPTNIIQQLTDLKLLSGITTSEINERMVHQMLSSGQYRKHLNKLHKKLHQSRERALKNFNEMCLNPYLEPEGGLFLWMKMPEHIDLIEMSNKAVHQNIMLAPGNLFSPHQSPSQYMRFNITSCNEPSLISFLKKNISI